MADNTILNLMSGGDTVADDDIGGVKYQRIKLVFGADGVNSGDVATANPLPITALDGASGAIFGTAAAMADTKANPTLGSIQAFLMGFNGTTWDRLHDFFMSADANGTQTGLYVLGQNLVFNGSTWDRMRGTTTGLQTIGGIGHGVSNAAGNNPVVQGWESIAHGANPTAVTAGQVTKGYANRAGIPFFLGGHPNIKTIELAATGAQTNVAIVTIATGLKIVVTQIQVTVANSNTVDVGFRVGFATATTPTTTGVVLTHPGLARGSGISRGDGDGIIGVGADDEDLRITSDVPTGGSIRVLVSYFTIET